MKQQPAYVPHVACPSCGNLSRIDFAIKNYKYTWWCHNEDCGKQYSWTWNDDESIDAEPTGTVIERNSVLLELPPQTESIYLILKGTKGKNTEYLYNEHQCPSNYLRDVTEVYINDDPDPHGLFKFVASIDKLEDVTLEDFYDN